MGFVPQRPASASHFTRNFIVFGTSGCGTISRALDEWGKRAFFQNGIANDCTFFDVLLAESIVDAFAFSSEMNGDLISWAETTGFFGIGKSISFDAAKTIVDAFTFSSKMDSELSTWAKATGFLHFSIAL